MNQPKPTIEEALRNFDHLPDSALVRQPVVLALFSIGATTVVRWIKDGRFPGPVKFGPYSKAWKVGELRQALAGTWQGSGQSAAA